jgi:hypothetical protein
MHMLTLCLLLCSLVSILVSLILTNKEVYASVKKPTVIKTIRLNRLRWFGHIQRMEENRIPKRVLYMT